MYQTLCGSVCSISKIIQVTITAGGNAFGSHVPPYYVFPGKRWNSDFLIGVPAPGSDGEMSPTGWSNYSVVINYLTKHFVTYSWITNKKDGPKILILYDRHKSHASLTLTEWASKYNCILIVLPSHSSHLTQPLDLGVFGPTKHVQQRVPSIYSSWRAGSKWYFSTNFQPRYHRWKFHCCNSAIPSCLCNSASRSSLWKWTRASQSDLGYTG